MKALIIDDSPTICTVVEYLLRHQGWDCEVAHSAKHGMELLSSDGHQIDLVIVDHTLNHIDGLSVLEEYRKQGRSTRSILLSQDDRDSIVGRAQDLGATCWVHKPLSLDNMKKAIEYSLNTKF
ncbi:response regulator [Pseudobacteriovorax antillogorgiicola]|uniref:Response regulator receiver domain-containing protein n=1 Tax=Pseudobacteriovorax antillogorgiicola TaxID=1513793 RepID=A0A1Y6CGJ9_9BACT|nr:response regulator [Pseudobacteriovorax antillogorgiicola]TCS46918.1 response regulator receiver domain-containing protein [Pseudobacteriovorax antillogorgiicola]SMF64172.1 Response regulator receiver domain-containing protein [Pseudobacteriovorax antillogorgiicola]